MTGLEIAEERERYTSRQRRCDERAAAALAAADEALAAQEEEKLAEERMVEAILSSFIGGAHEHEDY